MRIAVIGGGTAGLAATYELEKARAAGQGVEYTLYESRPRLGGALSSETVDGAVLERGPDSFLTEKPAAADLCRELGLGGELIPSNDVARKTFILVRNKLVALPDGLMFLVPTKLLPTALTRLFSLPTKIRMGLELLHPPRAAEGDEPVAALVERHYGREAVDRLADPLLSGIYGGDSTKLSVRTVLPRLVEMEKKYGSLTRGMLAAHKRMRAVAKSTFKGPARKAPPIFTAIRGGMQQLVDTLTARIDPASVRIGTVVTSIEKAGEGWRVVASGEAQDFDGVIMAAPAWAAGQMLSGVDPALAADLAAIPYSSSITVNLIYDEKKIGVLPEGFGFLVPACEGRTMLACTFVHRKFLGRTPPGKAVFRAFLGGARGEALLEQSDEDLIATVRRELSEILGSQTLGLTMEPDHVQISRWRRAMAQYAVGHQERIERIRGRVAALPGLRLAGNAYDGIGVPDCIRMGRLAARELAALSEQVRVSA